MNRPVVSHLTPESLRAPFARYSHAVVVEAGARLLFCSGQLGIGPDDAIPESAAEQTRLCFENIDVLLAAAGMGAENIARINAYVTDRDHLSDYMRERDRFIEAVDPPPASTLMIVSGFARAAFKVEVEVIAACEGD